MIALLAFALCAPNYTSLPLASSLSLQSPPISAPRHALEPYVATAPGYAIQASVPCAGYAVRARLADGSQVVFDGIDVVRVRGSSTTTLLHLASFAFPSFLSIDPTGTLACIGESTNDDIYAVPLDGSTPRWLANVHLNFDAAFEDAQTLLVSAGQCGFNCNTSILSIDLGTGAQTTIANIPGASGSLAIAPNGDLVYAQQTWHFPAPAASIRLLRWPAAFVASGSTLTDTNATVFVSALDGVGDIAFDATTDLCIVAESRFPGESELVAFRADGSRAAVLLRTRRWISNVQVIDVAGDATLYPYQPNGAAIECIASDFAFGAQDLALKLAPKRPIATVLGGSSTTLEIADAAPAGTFRVYAVPIASWSPTETMQPGFSFPCFSGAPLAVLTPISGVFALDNLGHGQARIPALGVPHGHMLQALVTDAQGHWVATSNAVVD